MTQLFLREMGQGEEWKEVFPDYGSGIKLTRSNNMITRSGTYTLEVVLPMDILQNRVFFDNMHRMERTKQARKYKCRLCVDNVQLLEGTAIVTQVTDSDVKVQIAAGKSEINVISEDEKTYIDEMEDLGTVVWERDGQGIPRVHLEPEDLDAKVFPVYDETKGKFVNIMDATDQRPWENRNAWSVSLNYVMKGVLRHFGMTIERNDMDTEPWNSIYIANARVTNHICRTLPHWLASEFVDEYCHFFNCTLKVAREGGKASIVSNRSMATQEPTAITPIGEYVAETEDSQGTENVIASNLEYTMPSTADKYNFLTQEIRRKLDVRQYSSRTEARSAYDDMDTEERKRYVFASPTGMFAELDGKYQRIDLFAPLVRQQDEDDSLKLRICPVHITARPFSDTDPVTHAFPTIANPAGDDNTVESPLAVQQVVDGETNEDKATKEDCLQVMFHDGALPYQAIIYYTPFVDWEEFTDIVAHKRWSLALNDTDADAYIGQLHKNPFGMDGKVRYTFKFIADSIPEPNGIFLIRGKLYACEKIEADITEQGTEKLMTGYFYQQA